MGIKRRITKARERSVTIEDAWTEFIEEKKALNKSPKSIISFEGSFKRWYDYIEASGYGLEVKDIDATYVYSFTNHFLNEEMKPTTLNHYLREIRAFLYWCMEDGREYVAPFKIKLVTEQEVIKETYTDDELDKLLARPKRNATYVEWRTWAIVNWIIATGNRASTVVNVRLGDINYNKREINITKTKSNKAMIIPLSPALNTVLKDFVAKWRYDATDDDFLFANIGGEQMTVDSLKHALRKYNDAREVDKTSIHALRHTFAKNWIRTTGDVFRLQKLLGHSTLEMTRKYVNMFNEDLKENFEMFNPLDNFKKGASRTQKVGKSKD